MTTNKFDYFLNYLILGVVLSSITGFSQSSNGAFNSDYKYYKSESVIQDKIFYFFTATNANPEVKKAFVEDKPLNSLLTKIKQVNQNAADSCGMNSDCHLDAFVWELENIDFVSQRLSYLYDTNSVIQKFVKDHLRASGNYQRYHKLENKNLLVKVWDDAAKGVNNIINVYGRGAKTLYPKIDSISYNRDEDFFKKLIDINVNSIVCDAKFTNLFFEPSLRLALDLLDSNDRDEVASHEPLQLGENKLAINYIPNIDWKSYKYSVILVPGYGPEGHGIALSPIARFRLKLAAERFKLKLAPIIVVSGGRVHPSRTVYNEAIEMKKELINKYGIPNNAIIIEPYARHTTTNFRNTSRLIYKYGIPTNKLALATTTKYQSEYIMHTNFVNRCIRDLEYVPIVLGKRLNENDIEFSPLPSSLHIDVMQPLDP